MFISQKKLFINIDALSQQYIISPPPPPPKKNKRKRVIYGQEKEVVIVEKIFFPALLQMVNIKIEIFPLIEECFQLNTLLSVVISYFTPQLSLPLCWLDKEQQTHSMLSFTFLAASPLPRTTEKLTIMTGF